MFKIDQRSSTPIYQQLVQEIKEAILKGILQPGDKLPSVRELSVQLTINPNTIQKSYQELERQKVIETLRGKGTFVSLNYKPSVDKEKLTVLKENLRNILVEAHYLGMKHGEILQLVTRLLEELNIKEGQN
ncbi:GntR family transcriptional regulator [Desulfallas sp. Bu1-1]|uniref:GntR family transcriptional regulator n=1 Tax=Desulfallas sp. Bu1-1 TaxID=2787620 RepID=UPI00189DD88B|nr:GntR family transcriptional regulator [Desulfallas sp. Bu1-1]MBF7083780.1 GntR family transcriptional regulator [Desulfallas sp. Bu1-1]